MMRKATKSGVWKLCSEYNRRKDADSNGFTKCVSCGKVDHYKAMDAGHFIPRARGKALYFEPDNIHAQCISCNRFDVERAKIGYTLYMIEQYGLARIEDMQQQARGVYRQRQSDLERWAEFYKQKLAELEQ